MKTFKGIGWCCLLVSCMATYVYAEPNLTAQQQHIVKAMVDAMAGSDAPSADKAVIINRIIEAANQGKAQEILTSHRAEIDEPWILYSAIVYSYMNKSLCVNYDNKCRAMIAADDVEMSAPAMTRQEEQEAEELSEKTLKAVGLGIPKFTN